ncbi:MAG: hypothetical protein HZA50_12185 [Planctomycetes bacterium]|nr:hypothetical protein [Planctomycetota bacterium]
MPIISAAALIVLGVLAASSFIVAKKPNAKELIDKIVPFQGWIGFVVCLWGLWTIIDALWTFGRLASLLGPYASFIPGSIWLWWLTYLLTGVLEAGLGFLMGYGLISKFILSKSPEAQAKGQAILAKLTKIQVPLGLAGIIFGVWSLLSWFILFPHF